jgi:hypothetical protein
VIPHRGARTTFNNFVTTPQRTAERPAAARGEQRRGGSACAKVSATRYAVA